MNITKETENDSQELLAQIIKHSMLVFHQLKDFKPAEPDEMKYRRRVELINIECESIMRLFALLKKRNEVLQPFVQHLTQVQKDVMCKDIIRGKIKSNDQSDEVAMLRREKEGLKEEVKAANRQLKGIIDGTRTLVRDLNSIQFYN